MQKKREGNRGVRSISAMARRVGGVLLATALAMGLTSGLAQAGAPHEMEEVEGPLAIMVLGSGGPEATVKGRASAGYLVFCDGQPCLLMDAGGGTFQRLAKSGVNVKDLDRVLLSHLHIDHTSDLSAIIKTIYFHNVSAGVTREAPIHIWGPAANGVPFPGSDIAQYPATTTYVDAHYAMPGGVERYLNIFTKAIRAGNFAYRAHDLEASWQAGGVQTVLERDGLKVTAIAVKHGPAPAVAYRIDYKGRSIVYSGDTNSESDNMITLSRRADLLIYDTAIMDDPANPVMLQLHTTPTRMGQVAAAARPAKLLLSHITAATEGQFAAIKRRLREQGFDGRVAMARDGKVYVAGDEDEH